MCGNLMVISLVSYSRNLHRLMYFFLTQLTSADIITASDIVPNLLHMVLHNGTSMSLSGCMTQLGLFGSSESAECLLLTVMSYDRYLAICLPLHYHSSMNTMVCVKYILISWFLGFTITLVQTVNVSQLDFCRSNVIDHFFCDFDPVLKLSCSSVMKIKLISFPLGLFFIVFPFFIVLISYVHIVHTILRIQSIAGRQKAFSTCGSHLAVVSIFYGTLCSIYMIPDKGKSIALRQIFSFGYTVVTPLVNPVIYCLRNKDIREAFQKITSSS
ncbi:olfactory receptor 1468-like [Engystomops pustulosus]|uniref:olfactory receptor 1468-like n=1 Tax=Engystomops pustulosus TaxID=76066 RepID=UPI003AFB0C7F